MRRYQPFVTGLLMLAFVLPTTPTAALEAADVDDPTNLADAYFAQLYGFDALEAYESIRGPARATFSVARRWQNGRAKILIDVQAPDSFSKWALLLLHNRSRSDDLFAYIPSWRRVHRLTAIDLEMQVLFQVLSLGEFRPIAPGELEYARLPEAEVEGETCDVIEGRPRHRGLGFDRVELAISPRSGLALRTVFFKGSNEIRRILVSPADIREYGKRRLPVRRRISSPPADGVTELVLRNLILDPVLPDSMFTHHNLRVQRFPSF